MGSKLKQKARNIKTLAPYNNRQAQHFTLELKATHQQLKKMEEEIWKDAWNEAEEWSNVVNTVTTMMALAELERYGAKRMLRLVKKANEYVGKANKGEMKIIEMIEILHKKGFGIDDRHKELVTKYGL